MKNLNKEIKVIKTIFYLISIIVIIVGLVFSYLIAELDDAPGFIFIGTTATLVCISFIYAFSEIIVQLKKNNKLLSDIYEELNKKK